MKSRKGAHVTGSPGAAKSKPAKPPRPPYRPPTPRVVIRALVLLDQGPLRRKAATECGREMAKLDKAKVEWKRFESEDKRAYERWKAATFGPLLSKLRETDVTLREKEALMQEVEMEIYYTGSTERSAYRRVMKRRNAPPPPTGQADGFDTGWGEEPPPFPPPPFDDGPADTAAMPHFDSLNQFEQELLFEEYLVRIRGMDPDRMSDAKYYRMFEEFRGQFEEARQASASRPREADPHDKPFPFPEDAPVSESARVKELYRLLVRRLHPDTRAESDAEVSALWHEVQEAYSDGDIERLEMLLALTDIQSNEAGDHTTLFQMRSVLAELRRSLKALQKNLRGARKQPAWNFARLPAAERKYMERNMRVELEVRLELQEQEVRRLDGIFASWGDKPKTGKGAGPAKKGAPSWQSDLPW